MIKVISKSVIKSVNKAGEPSAALCKLRAESAASDGIYLYDIIISMQVAAWTEKRLQTRHANRKQDGDALASPIT
jgi:hypothetical protein